VRRVRRANPAARILVTGCYAQRAPEELAGLAGVTWVVGNSHKAQIPDLVLSAATPCPSRIHVGDVFAEQEFMAAPVEHAAGDRTRPNLKIQDGCNNRCTFCIIPKLRGDLVSRPIAEVLREAEKLVAAGVKELLVVSQDTSAYGLDIRYAPGRWRDREIPARFVDLARELGSLGAWVRLHYVYPYPHVDDVIPLMADGVVLPYLDIPFQHASPSVLKAMRRPAAQEKTAERIRRWRETCPDLAIRSTVILGFPGETDADFELLLDWLREVKLERIGCFQYEPVTGATANDLGLVAVPDDVKASRFRRFMETQQAISTRRLAARVGQRIKVLVDTTTPTGAVGRSQWDAPEIDGKVHVVSRRPLRPGDLVSVKVDRADAYDLFATAV